MNRIFGGLSLVGAACAVLIGGCVGTSSEVGQMGEPDAGAMPDGGGGEDGGGTDVCEPGATKIAPDGCNTCSCDDGLGWSCTEVGCECKVGDKRTADDGCSLCVCDGGLWDCPPMGTGCGTECDEGAMKPAGDGCNTCSCFHGTWGCTLLDCMPTLVCDSGFADCDGDPANKCETNILTSVVNCGACGNTCAIAGASASCVDAKCVIDRCQAPYADCNGDPSDGCEVPTGDAGCKTRCEVSDGSPAITAAEGNCECPKGTTCVRNSGPEMVDYCYPNPEGCGSGIGDCNCLGSCVCPDSSAAQCTEQMTLGGFILDCDGLS